MAAQYYWQNRDPHTQMRVPIFHCAQTHLYKLPPSPSLLDSTPTYVVFTIKNTVILLWFATCLTNIQQSSITVVWTILQAQERQRQFYYSSSYLLFLCVIDLHCRCLITLCVIYILCNLYLFMSHPPYYMIYCSPLENYENVPCSLRVIQTMPSK